VKIFTALFFKKTNILLFFKLSNPFGYITSADLKFFFELPEPNTNFPNYANNLILQELPDIIKMEIL
jgi:hypothetical protein